MLCIAVFSQKGFLEMPLRFSTVNRDGYREFKSNPEICRNCPLLWHSCICSAHSLCRSFVLTSLIVGICSASFGVVPFETILSHFYCLVNVRVWLAVTYHLLTSVKSYQSFRYSAYYNNILFHQILPKNKFLLHNNHLRHNALYNWCLMTV